MPGRAWSPTLTDLLGVQVNDVTAEHIRQLVDDKVRETDELDFKATLYGKSDDGKLELCKDIAGLPNHRGGVIILGVGEKGGVANGCPEVEFSDAEERRMRQAVVSRTAPHADFEIHPVPGGSEARGFYLLLAEPSPFRPHAVLMDDGLRYPRRNGTSTRYLSEAEVADLYRDRFRGEKQQLDRLSRLPTKRSPASISAPAKRCGGWLSLSCRTREAISASRSARALRSSNGHASSITPVISSTGSGVTCRPRPITHLLLPTG